MLNRNYIPVRVKNSFMRLLVLTPIYATTTEGSGSTPVVHYFAREWAKMGHDVTVFFLRPKFPRPYYWFSKLFQHKLNTRLGMLVPIDFPKDEDFTAEGVIVHKRTLLKIKPHSRYSTNRLDYAIRLISDECEKNGVPDYFIGHWDNPQLEILSILKKMYNRPVCLVLHSNRFSFEKLYGNKAKGMLDQMDVIGFRSKAAQASFELKYGKPKSSFIAYSGVSEAFLKAGEGIIRLFDPPVRNFVFVGSLIARKHPKEIVSALNCAYPDGNYKITFIGDGAEKEQIEKEHARFGNKGELVFTGRIPREHIIEYLKNSDVFIMVSHDEVFGLVYLEAMALGVIPVGSKNEGIDGIIVNGQNGFLCTAGNVDELTSVLRTIKESSKQTLKSISDEARKTAQNYSDYGVAKKYLDSVLCF